MSGRWRHRRKERERGRVGGLESTKSGRGGGGRMTQKSTPPLVRRRSGHTLTPYWDTLYSTSATISSSEKKSRGEERKRSLSEWTKDL